MAQTFKQRARALFASDTVKAIDAPESVITIDSKSNLFEGFEQLIRNNILSAPVQDKEHREFIGFLDVRDLVSFVVFVYDEQKVNDNTRLRDLIQHGTGQFKMPTTDGVTVSYLARRNRFVSVPPDAPLQRVVEILAKGVHRVPVVNAQGNVINVISQSSIVKYLANRLQDAIIENPADPKIEDLPTVGTKSVLTVGKTASVISTFRLMDQKKRSGIAIVDETGRFVGTTTGKDLGLFLENPSLAVLNLPIFEHLQMIRAKQIDIKSPSISVFEHDKVSRAIGLIAATRVHRVFVVDNEKHYRPIRVLSITDILTYLLN
jgi:CBS domain-containing protein